VLIDGMGMGMLGKLVEGKEDTNGISPIEGPDDMGRDGVGPMALMESKKDIIRIPPIVFVDRLNGSATLDTLRLNMMQGSMNKEKGSLNKSLTYISIGVLGLVKVGLKFCGGNSSTTSTSKNKLSSDFSYVSCCLRGGCSSIMGSSPRNRWDRCCDSTTVKMICETQNTIQPKVNLDSKPKSTPLTNLGQQQANQRLSGPSKNQPSRGDEVPQD
jgi:hypothetical protein